MKHIVLIFLITISSATLAKPAPSNTPSSASFLISACQEYIELYDKKGDEHFGAFLTTSKEESFRAGYCLGAISHIDANDYC